MTATKKDGYYRLHQYGVRQKPLLKTLVKWGLHQPTISVGNDFVLNKKEVRELVMALVHWLECGQFCEESTVEVLK